MQCSINAIRFEIICKEPLNICWLIQVQRRDPMNLETSQSAVWRDGGARNVSAHCPSLPELAINNRWWNLWPVQQHMFSMLTLHMPMFHIKILQMYETMLRVVTFMYTFRLLLMPFERFHHIFFFKIHVLVVSESKYLTYRLKFIRVITVTGMLFRQFPIESRVARMYFKVRLLRSSSIPWRRSARSSEIS